MPRTKPPYPPAFRTEAVRLVHSSGKAIPVIAHDLGVSDQALRGWVRQAEIDTGQRAGFTSGEHEELRQLRRENRILKEERDILKKAAAFFARERNAIRSRCSR
jgi:transposase